MIETSFKNSQNQNFKLFQKHGGAFIRLCAFIRDNTVTGDIIFIMWQCKCKKTESESLNFVHTKTLNFFLYYILWWIHPWTQWWNSQMACMLLSWNETQILNLFFKTINSLQQATGAGPRTFIFSHLSIM